MGNIYYFHVSNSFSENYYVHTSFTAFSENIVHLFRTRLKTPVVIETRVGEKEK